jgi:hypothetical protein
LRRRRVGGGVDDGGFDGDGFSDLGADDGC